MIFAACAFVVAAGLSFRPIPDELSHNDTGRYVLNQAQACSLPLFEDTSVALPWQAFNLLMSPACVGNSQQVFLFCAAIAVPIAFLLFANWSRDETLLLALGFLACTINFEFMSNALRQGVSLNFLFAGFHFKSRPVKVVAFAAAMLIHDSSWFFVPLAILIEYRSGALSKRDLLIGGLPILACAGYLFNKMFLAQFGALAEMLSFYTQSYQEELSGVFLAFIVVPLLLIFVLRWLDGSSKPSLEERTVFWYSSAIIFASVIFFPAITYRFAMTAIALQVFMAMRYSTISIRNSAMVSFTLTAHFAVYIFLAKNVAVMFYG